VSVGGTMEAMDATTGAEVWEASVGAGAVDSAAIDSNTLYIGSDGGLLSALDATTGAVQCSFQLPILSPETTPGRIESSPVVGHDSSGPIVYFGDTGQSESVNRGREWAMYGYGNTNGNCTEKWMFDLVATSKSKHSGTWSPPALVVDSTGRTLVVFGTGQPDDAVYALDASTGARVWRFQTTKNFSDADVGAGPTISAPGVNNAHGIVYIDGRDRIEYAIDLLTGTQLWDFDMGADANHKTNSVSCAALDGDIVVVAYANYVYEFNATTGAKLFRSVAMAGSVLGSVIISGAPGSQIVLLGDLTGRVYICQFSNLQELANVQLAKTKLAASIAISDGMAYVADENGIVYGLS
jgi:outer membrane protein assembly factor BamB